MIVLAIILAAALASVVGAAIGVRVGRELGHREGRELGHAEGHAEGHTEGRELGHADTAHRWTNIDAACRRAQHASALLESADLPAVLEHVDSLHRTVQGTRDKVTEAERQAAEAVARVHELEQDIAGGLGITLGSK